MIIYYSADGTREKIEPDVYILRYIKAEMSKDANYEQFQATQISCLSHAIAKIAEAIRLPVTEIFSISDMPEYEVEERDCDNEM